MILFDRVEKNLTIVDHAALDDIATELKRRLYAITAAIRLVALDRVTPLIWNALRFACRTKNPTEQNNRHYQYWQEKNPGNNPYHEHKPGTNPTGAFRQNVPDRYGNFLTSTPSS